MEEVKYIFLGKKSQCEKVTYAMTATIWHSRTVETVTRSMVTRSKRKRKDE